MGHAFFIQFASLSTIFLLMLPLGATIKCWVCGRNDIFCQDTFDKDTNDTWLRDSYYKECNDPGKLTSSLKDYVAVCKKRVLAIDAGTRTEYKVIRSCEYEKRDNIDEKQCDDNYVPNYKSKVVFCGICRTDGCNSAIQSGSINLILLSITFALSLNFLLIH